MTRSSAFPDPEQIGKVFGAWRSTFIMIATTIVSGLTAVFNIDGPLAYVVAGALTLAGLLVAIWLYRLQTARREAEERVEARSAIQSDRALGAAFRGLRRYQQGESLPGVHRRRVAATLLAQVQQSTTEVCIVTGVSGAGKSSLLGCALVDALEKAGLAVITVTNPARRAPYSQAEPEAADIARIWQSIEQDVAKKRTESQKAVVLILDQFEELLSRFRSDAMLTLVGSQISRAIADGWRVVIGLRKEYLPDLKPVVSQFPQPAGFDSVFLVRNFEPAEAAEVIRECAERDRIPYDPGLPDLIAADLTMDGTVRPSDLQIVCEAFHGELRLDEYRRAGRASGLRSRFIRDMIELTGDSILARAVLRELCDLPNNKKKAVPISASYIAEKARLGAPGARASEDAVSAVLESLERAYIVVKERSSNTTHWSLIHDYLVEPIKLATEEQATMNELAASELEYHLAEVVSGRIKVIPLSRLRRIRRYAPPALLAQPAAARLIRKSVIVGYGEPVAFVTSVAVVSVTLVLAAGTQRGVWQVISPTLEHWDKPGDQRLNLTAKALPDNGEPIMLEPFITDGRRTVWDAKTGERVAVFDGYSTVLATDAGIWTFEDKTGRLELWTNSGKAQWSVQTPQLNRPGDMELSSVIGNTPSVTAIFANRHGFGDPSRAVFKTGTDRWRTIATKDYFPSRGTRGETRSRYAWTSAMFATAVSSAGKARLTIWPHDLSKPIVDRSFDGSVQWLGGTVTGDVTRFSMVTGSGVETLPIRAVSSTKDTNMSFVAEKSRIIPLPSEYSKALESDSLSPIVKYAGGQLLFIESGPTRTVIWPFDPFAEVFRKPYISHAPAPLSSKVGMSEIVVWSAGPAEVMVWPRDRVDPYPISGIQTQYPDRVTFTSDLKRLLKRRSDGRVELWRTEPSASGAKLLQTIPPGYTSVAFSDDQAFIIARQQGGVLSGWTLDGESLGQLGIVGSNVIWSTYDQQCQRILIWTAEGQSLELRRGALIPLYGFRPAGRCRSRSQPPAAPN